MATRKTARTASKPAPPRKREPSREDVARFCYAAGYRQCAEDVISEMDGRSIHHHLFAVCTAVVEGKRAIDFPATDDNAHAEGGE